MAKRRTRNSLSVPQKALVVGVFLVLVSVVGGILLNSKYKYSYKSYPTPTIQPIPTPVLTPGEKIIYTYKIHVTAPDSKAESLHIDIGSPNKRYTVSEGSFVRVFWTGIKYSRITVSPDSGVLETPRSGPDGLVSSGIYNEVAHFKAIDQGDAAIIITE